MSLSIFISYNHKNRCLVDILANDLTIAGYVVWFDREISGGRSWWDDILARIRDNDVFVVALTQRYLDSKACMDELKYASDLGKNILPVALSDISYNQLPPELQPRQIVEFRQHSKIEALNLVKALHSLPELKPLPNPLPPEPDIPLAPIVQIRNEMVKSQFTASDQQTFLTHIKKLLKDNPSNAGVYDLLDYFRAYKPDSLLSFIEKEISHLLEQKPQNITNRSTVLLEPRTFVGHRGDVTGVAFSLDNRYIFSSSHDFTARQWDSVTGEEIRRFKGHDGKVTCMDLHPNNEILLTGSEDETARLWDVNSGKEIRKLDEHIGKLVSVGFAKESDRFFTADYTGMINVWDIQSTACLSSIETGYSIQDAGILHNGLLIVVAQHESIRPKISVWNIETGNLYQEFLGHQDFITQVSFAPDGKYILSSSNDQTDRFWNVETGSLVQPFIGHRNSIYCSAFSVDGEYIISGSSESLLWKIGNDEPLLTLKHSSLCRCLAISSDNQYALIGTADNMIYLRETGLVI